MLSKLEKHLASARAQYQAHADWVRGHSGCACWGGATICDERGRLQLRIEGIRAAIEKASPAE